MRATKCARDADAGYSLDLSDLQALYSAQSLRMLISRALEHLDKQQSALDIHIAAGEYAKAAEVLHQMKGTASFFAGDAQALDALHAAEDALRASDPELAPATLPGARRVLAAFRHALAAQFAALPREPQ